MDEAAFYDRVESRAEFEEGELLAITHATLEVLSERIGEGQARDMAEHLPQPIAESLTHHPGDPATFSREEFVARIASEANADFGERDERVRAVLVAQLPNEFEELFSTAACEVRS